MGGGAEREGDRESQTGSALSAQTPKWGSNSPTVRSCPELKPRVGRDRATQAPLAHFINISGAPTTCWVPF